MPAAKRVEAARVERPAVCRKQVVPTAAPVSTGARIVHASAASRPAASTDKVTPNPVYVPVLTTAIGSPVGIGGCGGGPSDSSEITSTLKAYRRRRLPERPQHLPDVGGDAGYKRGATIDRCKENGDLVEFRCYCPKAYAGLDQRSTVSTLLSRSITVRLERKTATERVSMWIAPLTEPSAKPLRARCGTWAQHNVDALVDMQPDLPEGLANRAAEVWWALLVVADHVGGDWPERARAASRVLSAGGDQHDDSSDQVLLLSDIREAFGKQQTIFTKALLDDLNARDESPWGARRRGEGLDARGLSQLLRPFKIKPRTIGSGADVAARMPLLSTYLRHVDPVATYWYLSASPELLGLAARRLELASEGCSGGSHPAALAVNAWPGAMSDERAGSDSAGVLHRPADQSTRRQPAHDRGLPRHLPAAARLHPADHRQAADRA
jgi:Protein of unknown function (DUF3631)